MTMLAKEERSINQRFPRKTATYSHNHDAGLIREGENPVTISPQTCMPPVVVMGVKPSASGIHNHDRYDVHNHKSITTMPD